MSDLPDPLLPRRPIEPLAPPPGQFDAVLTRARRRRYDRGSQMLSILLVFAAGLAGGMSLDGGVSSVPRAVFDFTSNAVAPRTEPTPSDTDTAATVTPDVSPSPETRTVTQTAPAEMSPSPHGVLAVRGRALSTGGDPVAGLYVYPGISGADGFVPAAEPVTRTDTQGLFSLPCPGTPVLLSPWRVNVVVEAASAQWAATFVGGATQPSSATVAPCSRSDKVLDVVLQRGATLTGAAAVPARCEGERPLRLLLYGDPAVTVRLGGLGDGDPFGFGGLPPGGHLLAAGTTQAAVVVAGSATTVQDVTFTCDVQLPGTTPTPTPAPSESAPPSPSGNATTAPEPTPGNTSSPSPTPTPATTSTL